MSAFDPKRTWEVRDLGTAFFDLNHSVFSRINYRQLRIGFPAETAPNSTGTEDVMSATLINLIIQLIAGAVGVMRPVPRA
jgi:hypothetical protein